MSRPRVRQSGLIVGKLATGAYNSITDVTGVRVGHTTLVHGTGSLRPGYGPVRTGVTAVLPHGGNLFRHKVRAAVHTINGFGKAIGFEQVRELGRVETPITLTNTLNVGLVADALIQYVIRQNADVGINTSTVNVVVGETNDAYLNDLQGRHVRADNVWAAIESASDGSVPEGAVGAGTGTSCFDWKGGIGTASRVLPRETGGYTVGTLVQSNYGQAENLVICGVAVGQHIQPPELRSELQPDGSVMIVLATDAPLSARQLTRLCKRAAAGLALTGSTYNHGSGDFVIAFSTAHLIDHEPATLTTTETVPADEQQAMSWLFPAVVETVEEAVLNSLFQAETVTGRDGNTQYELPIDDVVALVKRYRPPNQKL